MSMSATDGPEQRSNAATGQGAANSHEMKQLAIVETNLEGSLRRIRSDLLICEQAYAAIGTSTALKRALDLNRARRLFEQASAELTERTDENTATEPYCELTPYTPCRGTPEFDEILEWLEPQGFSPDNVTSLRQYPTGQIEVVSEVDRRTVRTLVTSTVECPNTHIFEETQ